MHHKVNKSLAIGSWQRIVKKFKEVVLRQKERLEIYTDASYINQHHVGAICFIAVKDGQPVYTHIERLEGKSEVYILELTAIVAALRWASKKYPDAKLEIFTDSQGAIDAINGNYKNKSFKKLSNIKHCFILKEGNYKISHIKAHQNTNNFNDIADKKARQCARKYAKKIISKKSDAAAQSK